MIFKGNYLIASFESNFSVVHSRIHYYWLEKLSKAIEISKESAAECLPYPIAPGKLTAELSTFPREPQTPVMRKRFSDSLV